ncbi:MAG TPA: tripartite tricarboxylate transporter substrate binding protein [Alphaproteobacteria bacterium]|nr:tripartite tricarboxylate transporter substrate binding protein [Alphaproteobacteria bacterium]
MGLRRFLASIALAVLVAPAYAQEYPSRPIEFIVPWGPGGGADQVARKAAKIMEPLLKVSIPVINVAGATGVTGLNKMLTAEADGYTMSIMTGDTFGMLASTQPKWGLDDFVPLAIMIRQPSALFVAEGGKYKTWADVEAAAKAGPLKVAITGFGSPDDMTVNFFNKKGLKFVSVPFPRPGERYSAILGGHADILYEQLGDVRSFLDGKQMRPVLIFATERFKAFPDIPVSKELGHDIILPQFRMVTVKTGTDPNQAKKLASALEVVAKDPEYVAYLEEQYADSNSYIGGSAARKFLEDELAAMKALLK